MRIGLPFVALMIAAAVAARLYFDHTDGLSFWWQSTGPTQQKNIGPAFQHDPLAATSDDSGPLPAATNGEQITEAAYHQQPITTSMAFGPDENTGGEEVLTLQ